MNQKIKTIEDYIKQYPKALQLRMQEIYEAIKTNAAGADEGISYGMPAFKLNKKPLVYFACYDQHIGFYATPTGHEKFKKQLSIYKQGKGSVQFPHDQALPIALIADIVKFRVEENKTIQ